MIYVFLKYVCQKLKFLNLEENIIIIPKRAIPTPIPSKMKAAATCSKFNFS